MANPSAGGTPGAGGNNPGSGGSVVIQQATAGLGVFSAACSDGKASVGSTPVRRISRIEYNNMVRDLGLDPNNTQPANQFVSEQKIDTGKAGNFNTNTYATVSGTLMNQQYLEAAEGLASAIAANTNNQLTNLLGCNTQNAACAQQFIASFGGKAFRGQLDATETANLNTLFTTVSVKFDFASGIQAVIEAVLTSPRFLFVLEFGQPNAAGDAVPLTPMELATRLALYLWRSLPDQALIDAANNGHLATPSDVATQAARMLADSRAKAALADFADQWLDIENMNAVTKDTQFTKWTANLAADLHTETLTTFTQAVITNSDYKTLLTSPSSYINGDLASFYGVGGNPSFNTATNVNSASNPRYGILTQGSVLAGHAHTSLASPTKRGRLVRQQILCEEVPDPPAAVAGKPIPPPPTTLMAGATTRDAYTQHVAANETCSACHQWMDWLGFGFDQYDATGAFLPMENNAQVDSSGKFVPFPNKPNDMTGTFSGTSDMVTQLSMSEQVMQCFALQEMRYALLRSETTADACSAQRVYQAFMSNGYNLQKLILAVVSSDAFMYRTAVNAGGDCK
ncbi:MAG TPA: DUF1592 domain-containing protein [Polyangia bacterium]|nr:DUF1592 domain-containing protein [Polyangia bacterium]